MLCFAFSVSFYSLNSNLNIFHVFFASRLPFNWQTMFGYSIALLGETSGFYSTVLGCVPFLCFLVGPCGMFLSIAKDIAGDIRALDVDHDDYQDEREREWKVKENFCNVVQLFADAKQSSRNS